MKLRCELSAPRRVQELRDFVPEDGIQGCRDLLPLLDLFSRGSEVLIIGLDCLSECKYREKGLLKIGHVNWVVVTGEGERGCRSSLPLLDLFS